MLLVATVFVVARPLRAQRSTIAQPVNTDTSVFAAAVRILADSASMLNGVWPNQTGVLIDPRFFLGPVRRQYDASSRRTLTTLERIVPANGLGVGDYAAMEDCYTTGVAAPGKTLPRHKSPCAVPSTLVLIISAPRHDGRFVDVDITARAGDGRGRTEGSTRFTLTRQNAQWRLALPVSWSVE
jgi:hypothetical protein